MSPSAPGRSSCALLVDRESEAVAGRAARATRPYTEPALQPRSRRSCRSCIRLAPELRLPLVSMAVPALRRLSREQLEAFAAGVRELIRADDQVSLYEYALQRLLFRHLAGRRGAGSPAGIRRDRPSSWPGRCGTSWGSWPTWAAPGRRTRLARSTLGIRALGWPEVDPSLPPRDLDLADAGPRAGRARRRRAVAQAADPRRLRGLHRRGRPDHPRGGRAAPRDRGLAGMPVPPLPSLAGVTPDGDDRAPAP